jgi:5-methylcytosine-specific restriction enzyme subunit McrC
VTLIELDELGPPQPVRLAPHVGRALDASGVVEARPDLAEPGLWLVQAAGVVGVARIADVEIWVRPKVPIEGLLFLLGYAKNPLGWRDETADVEARDDLVPALAQALGRQSERALQQGLLQGYRVCEEAAPVLRGRLREADQLRRRFGMPFPIEIRYDEFTVDIAENQLLRAAAERMLRVPRVDVVARRRLRHVLSRLADASALVRGQPLPTWQPSRLNARYHSALRLAELVLRGTSVDQTPGTVAVNGFLLAMPRLFEDFVTVALTEELRRYGGRADKPTVFLDEERHVRMIPDLVWWRSGAPAAVIDAKYKAEKPAGFPDADLYQMLAYCTALDLPRGHLVYARGNEQPARYVVRHCAVEIVCHALDLDRPPAALLEQIRDVARAASDVGVDRVSALLPS